MVRILVVLVGVGVLVNALTFLMVAHYFSSRGGEAAIPSASSVSSPAPTPHPELLRRLDALERSLSSLTKKVDGIAARPPQASSVASSRRISRLSVPRPPPTAGGSDLESAAAGGEEGAAAAGPAEEAPAGAASLPQEAPASSPPAPAPPAETEKPASSTEGQAAPAPEGSGEGSAREGEGA